MRTTEPHMNYCVSTTMFASSPGHWSCTACVVIWCTRERYINVHGMLWCLGWRGKPSLCNYLTCNFMWPYRQGFSLHTYLPSYLTFCVYFNLSSPFFFFYMKKEKALLQILHDYGLELMMGQLVNRTFYCTVFGNKNSYKTCIMTDIFSVR
jgi:hypothetical protein